MWKRLAMRGGAVRGAGRGLYMGRAAAGWQRGDAERRVRFAAAGRRADGAGQPEARGAGGGGQGQDDEAHHVSGTERKGFSLLLAARGRLSVAG